MDAELPGGFSLRSATADDIEVVAAIVRAEEEAIRGASIWQARDMLDFWRHVDFEQTAWLVERDEAPVAFAAGINRDGRIDCWATVHPDARGRGLANALLARVEDRARAFELKQVNAGALAENDAARDLFAARGYREGRHYFQMRIELDRELDPPDPVPGIELTAFRREDARNFHVALNEAFADEWGFFFLSFEEWERTRLDAPETDLSLWYVARSGDEIAAVARCEDGRDGGGWIGAIGVRKAWRRQGVGLALLKHAFCEFQRRGEPHVGLGVDAQNPTGATRLYERAGMRVIKEDVIFEKKLA